MKYNKGKILFILCLVTTVFIFCSLNVKASPATSYTYTLNSKGRLVRTQDAYLPERTIIELDLKNPQDLFFDQNDIMYIADTGNKRVIKYDPNTDEVILIIKNSEFTTPTGLFVTDNKLYIADKSANKVFIYDIDGSYLYTIDTPDEIAFEGKTFDPNNIAVDKSGNIFINAETIPDGIIQLSSEGNFLGYFTSNDIELTTIERIRDFIFTEEQKEKLFPRTPKIFSDVYIDNRGFIYTASMNSDYYGIKRHNISGGNMFDQVLSLNDPIDIYTNSYGVIFVAMSSGTIFVYTQDGDYIFSFGASNFDAGRSVDVSGLFNSISSIAVDSTGRVWVLDDKKSFIQSFTSTEYADKIYQALDLYYNDRDYEASVKVWNDVLRLNQMSVLAHNYIGKNYLVLRDYERAMYHFEIANNRDDFSDAFWEIRNLKLQKYLGPVFILLIILIILSIILKVVDKYKPFKYKIKAQFKKILNIKIIDDLLYMFRVMRHPLDSFYEIKKGNKGSLLGAWIIFILFFVIYIWSLIGKDFIYQFIEIEDIDLKSITMGFFGLIFLFIICNYLVTSITDGEGKLKHIFMMFMYSLAPLILSLIGVTLLSYILTYNESFFLDVLMIVGYSWAGLNILLGVQEVHNYTTRKAIKSIIISLAFMAIFIVILIIVIVMWEQLFYFFETIIREAIRNASD